MKKCLNLTLGTTYCSVQSDDSPDTSYLGEYTEKYIPGCIIRGDNTFYEDHTDDEEYEPPTLSREYSFFIPPDNGEKPGTDDYKKYAMQDYRRTEALNRGLWWHIGITLSTVISSDNGLSVDSIRSSVWGIESDSGKDYIKEIISDLSADIRSELQKIGFKDKEIDKTLKNIRYSTEAEYYI